MHVPKAGRTSNKTPSRCAAHGGGERHLSAPKGRAEVVAPPQTRADSDMAAIEEKLCELEQYCINSIQDFFGNLRSQQHPLGHRKPRRGLRAVKELPDISRNEIIRPSDLPLVCGLSSTTIWRLQKVGDFVPKLRLSNGRIGYSRESIQDWLKNRQINKESIND